MYMHKTYRLIINIQRKEENKIIHITSTLSTTISAWNDSCTHILLNVTSPFEKGMFHILTHVNRIR